MDEALYKKFEDKIFVLNDVSWESRINRQKISDWLSNFDNDVEKLNAMHLLSHFMYFGSGPIRELLKTLYRDLYKYPVVECIRKRNRDTRDSTLINKEFNDVLRKTRFLGIGNPSESGPHLLYYFRQENRLRKDLFINPFEILRRTSDNKIEINDPVIDYYVCIDDFCGSGDTAGRFAKEIVTPLKGLNGAIKVVYFSLFGTDVGKNSVRSLNLFDEVKSIFTLDSSFKCFDSNSRYFKESYPNISRLVSEQMCRKYGYELYKSILIEKGVPLNQAESLSKHHALGFDDGQLIMGFHHNTPDNTIPVFWYDEGFTSWTPIFKRYNK